MNGIITGLILVAVGVPTALIAWITARKTGTTFVSEDEFAGYNGVVGIAIAVVGLLTILGSIVHMAVS